MDRDDIADNLVRKWKHEPRNALEVSANLVTKIIDVFKEAMVEEDD
jgi:hypothetical protein